MKRILAAAVLAGAASLLMPATAQAHQVCLPVVQWTDMDICYEVGPITG